MPMHAIWAAAGGVESWLSDPEKLTVAGLLVAAVLALITERVVPGSRLKRAEAVTERTERQRDRLFDLCLRLAGAADASAKTSEAVMASVNPEAYREAVAATRLAGPMEGSAPSGNDP